MGRHWLCRRFAGLMVRLRGGFGSGFWGARLAGVVRQQIAARRSDALPWWCQGSEGALVARFSSAPRRLCGRNWFLNEGGRADGRIGARRGEGEVRKSGIPSFFRGKRWFGTKVAPSPPCRG